MEEQRSAARVRGVLKAEVRFDDGAISVPCVVRDISDTGARLELAGDVALPDRIDLFIEKRQRTYRAKVKRRSGREVGVAFEETEAEPEEPGDMQQRMEKLENEVAELRQAVAALAAAVARPAEPPDDPDG
jgi:hypothetical protein